MYGQLQQTLEVTASLNIDHVDSSLFGKAHQPCLFEYSTVLLITLDRKKRAWNSKLECCFIFNNW